MIHRPEPGGHSVRALLLVTCAGLGVALPGPGVDDLAGLLPDAAQRHERLARVDAGLLLELPARGRQQLLALVHDALGNGPGTGVPVAPERPARMRQEHLEAEAAATEEQQTRAQVGPPGPAGRGPAQWASTAAPARPRGFPSRRMAGATTRKLRSSSIQASL